MILIIKHISIEGPGYISEFFKGTSWDIKTLELNKGDKLPKGLSSIEAIISLGGPMNVYEEERHPFLGTEERFLKKAMDMNIPIIGICLGAQLLAKTAGARIKKSDRNEMGWVPVLLTEDGRRDPLFRDLENHLEVFQWHEDQFDVPEGGLLLAKSAACPKQAFRIGENAYGLQFHFEVTPVMVENWLEKYAYGKTEEEKVESQCIALAAHRKKDDFSELSRRIMYNFAGIISNRKHRKV